jgi:ATP synthase F1 complex assembly factor 2
MFRHKHKPLLRGIRYYSIKTELGIKPIEILIDQIEKLEEPVSTSQTSVGEGKTQMTRFWKEATLGQTPTHYEIMLDQRALKTPNGKKIEIPLAKRTLALLTAAEWEAQQSVVKAYSLPLTSIIMRAIDSFEDEKVRKNTIDQLMMYVNTDSICYQQSYPESLQVLQSKYWGNIIEWLQKDHGIVVNTTDGILPIKQSESTLKKFRDILESYDNFKLAAFEKACLRSKSFMTGLALAERAITAEEATMASRLEVHHQIQRWGECEDAHDLEREDARRQLGSCAASLIQ